jgi:hypothetical protein
MVLHVPSNATQGVMHVDADTAEVFGIADTGELQDMRRADRASRQDYLTRGFDALHAAVAQILDTDRSHAIEPDAMHQRTGDDLEVGPLHRWAQIAACRTGAPPATSRLLHPADAIARARGQVVDVLAVFEPQLPARFDRRLAQQRPVAPVRCKQRTTRLRPVQHQWPDARAWRTYPREAG